MGARSRKRRRAAPEAPPQARPRRRVVVGDAAFAPREGAREPRVRGAARDEQIRAGLDPLASEERPLPLRIAAVVALLFGVLNVVLLVVGYDLRGREDPQAFGVLLFAFVMVVAAGGIWTRRYWAVLGFQCLLAITVVYSAASLAVATNWQAVALCVAIIGGAGWLFWKLIRVMARMQMPQRPGDARG